MNNAALQPLKFRQTVRLDLPFKKLVTLGEVTIATSILNYLSSTEDNEETPLFLIKGKKLFVKISYRLLWRLVHTHHEIILSLNIKFNLTFLSWCIHVSAE